MVDMDGKYQLWTFDKDCGVHYILKTLDVEPSDPIAKLSCNVPCIVLCLRLA